jgi:succinate dehydrogenase / fumarate reductase membrane anchor subunit
MDRRTPLGRVRGLGSAKEGTEHFWAQRVTAIALIPLALWFVASLAAYTGADHATAKAWLAEPFTAIVMILLVAIGFHHAQLGIQVVIEDYVSTEWIKVFSIIVVKLAAVALAVAAIFSVLKIAFGS